MNAECLAIEKKSQSFFKHFQGYIFFFFSMVFSFQKKSILTNLVNSLLERDIIFRKIKEKKSTTYMSRQRKGILPKRPSAILMSNIQIYEMLSFGHNQLYWEIRLFRGIHLPH